jgi:hypothetical protein
MRPEHKADAETIQIMFADWTADRAALRGLLRELRDLISKLAPSVAAELDASVGLSLSYPHVYNMLHNWHEDACAYLARAEALAGEPGEGGSGAEVARLQREAFVAGRLSAFTGTSGGERESEAWAIACRRYPDVPPTQKAGEEGRRG